MEEALAAVSSEFQDETHVNVQQKDNTSSAAEEVGREESQVGGEEEGKDEGSEEVQGEGEEHKEEKDDDTSEVVKEEKSQVNIHSEEVMVASGSSTVQD